MPDFFFLSQKMLCARSLPHRVAQLIEHHPDTPRLGVRSPVKTAATIECKDKWVTNKCFLLSPFLSL